MCEDKYDSGNGLGPQIYCSKWCNTKGVWGFGTATVRFCGFKPYNDCPTESEYSV